jgi:hypothetical protein
MAAFLLTETFPEARSRSKSECDLIRNGYFGFISLTLTVLGFNAELRSLAPPALITYIVKL